MPFSRIVRHFATQREALVRMKPTLDHKSAVCFIPPRQTWDTIQEIRCFRDKSFVRWPPHINLLYPFWTNNSDNFDRAGKRILEVVRSFKPFTISLCHFRYFNHGSTCTVWLEPKSDHLTDLQMALAEAFPECFHLNNDPSRGIDKFIPHLSVGQWPNQRLAEEAIVQLSATFQPIEVDFKDIHLINRMSHQSPFEIKTRIALGDYEKTGIEVINVGYVASVGAMLEACERWPYGLGSYTQGVWNFAYGANVNSSKLINSRNITPLESIQGLLPGYRLAFNHFGGMGNVERMTQAAENYFNSRGIHGVHGILHRLSLTDFARLTNIESGYRPLECIAETRDGRGTVRAIVFKSPQERCIRERLAPTNRYIQLILRGAKEWEMDPNYIQWLESVESIPSQDRGPLYWRTAEGARIEDRIIRVGSDPEKRRKAFGTSAKRN